jgi:CBS domain-containing protein
MLPVVDGEGKLVGIVTDRDMSIALATMKEHCIRRLPVEGFGRTVAGVVSMNDILLAAGARKAIRTDEVVDTLQAICAHWLEP